MSREGGCFAEVRPINCTPQSSPFIRKLDQFTPTELQWRRKRMKVSNDWEDTSNCVNAESKYKRDKSYPDVIDYSDPFSVPNLKEELNRSMYGSVTKDIEDLRARRFKMLNPLLAIYPSLSSRRLDFSPQSPTTHNPVNGTSREIIVVDDDCVANVPPAMEDLKLVCKFPSEETYGYGCRSFHSVGNGHQNDNNKLVVILDSDDEESAEQIGSTQAFCESQTPNNLDLHQGRGLIAHPGTTLHEFRGDQIANNMRMTSGSVPHTVPDANRRGSLHYHGVVLKKAIDESPLQSLADRDGWKSKDVVEEQKTLIAEKESKKDTGVYVGVQDDLGSNKSSSGRDFDDDLGDIWREMTLALECNKDAAGDIVEHSEDEEGEECDHSFFLKDDLGYVCRVCGVIKKSIETIFEFQWGKGSKTSRVYMSESRSKEREENDATPFSRVKGSHDLAVVDISVHPRHMKQMKTHQREGFNFLVRNLISDNPGGCILAHAPGSGKTFMIISFIQSFLTKYPNDARPLVVLPKGILGTWKREFIRWQVEDIPLYDLYSAKTESRKDQLDVLKQWVEHKGILFLGYKQLANIVSKSGNSLDAACQDILLTVPTILILDEGHTPRNQETDVLQSLEKVQTPRKVVLSGTLFQNNVKEVFNILNLVRPKFLKSDTSKAIKRRVMSRGQIGRKQIKTGADEAFYEVVEDTLKSEENSKVKVAVIQDLREMTRDVLHYYKGDFLDELPGFVDLTVLLNLSPKQKHIEQKELQKLEKFKRISVGTAVYLHPLLKDLSENGTKADKLCNVNDDKLNDIIRRMDYREGVKAKFFLGILGLCESTGEKLLVFSQYKLPLKFLEMLVANSKGWSHGKETFMISGDTSAEDREWSMERFNNSSDAKVLFGSIKACGEGISLVGASRVLIMDVHLNPSVTRQAVGRAYRPGQEKKVYVYRLVAADTLEEEYHNSSFRKELISKMWFEWSEYCGDSVFEMETVNVEESDDVFWQSPVLREDLNIVKKR